MGPENAGHRHRLYLERAGHITSAGGYLRSLTAKTSKASFARPRAHGTAQGERAICVGPGGVALGPSKARDCCH